jgi:transcriptional regulator with XRE-family HTH domain
MVWHFDARGFGRALRERREELGYSTRDLAHLAGVSQSYVVALEGSRSSRDAAGPSPTIDVLARLASALGTEPAALLAPSVHRSGPHVLLVVEDDGASLFGVAKSFAADVDTWVTAGHRRDTAEADHHIALHLDASGPYDHGEVALAIDHGLATLSPVIDGQRLGLIFSEDPSVLIEETAAVLDAEHDWSAMVSRAACSAGARSAWNLCVYELDVLRQMTDPLAASLELIRSHDTVWTTSGSSLHRNRAASMRLLQHLRPPRTSAEHWRQICTKQLDRISTE